MKQYQILLYSLAFILLHFASYGQENGVIVFSEIEYDFKDIKEEDGEVTHEFEFENSGDAPLVLSNVRASCGCTTPDWSREPVLSGEKGFIKVQYNPRNRPGSFRKTLTITSNARENTSHLYIKGKVIPRKRSIEEIYAYKVGAIRMTSRTVNLSRITTEKPVTKSFEVYNDSEDTIRFLSEYDAPKHIAITYLDEIIAPKMTGEIEVVYDPIHKDNLGVNSFGITLYTDEQNQYEKGVTILSTVSEYFPPMTEKEKDNAPQLLIQDRMRDLGTIRDGVKRIETFHLTNGGKTKLNIRKVKPGCSCITTELDNNNIQPGSSTILKVTFDASQRKGRQTSSISIFSNDPALPTQLITIRTSVTSN